MPYALTFSRVVEITDPDQYINDCCIGGDVVLEQILPVLKTRYSGATAVQEDWGWFSWFEFENVKFAVDVHTLESNSFQIHLTSRKSRFLLPPKVIDTPELETLRGLVLGALTAWPVDRLNSEKVDDKFLPMSGPT